MNNNFVFTSSIVDLAEEQDYLTLKNRVCFFNDKNLNSVQLDYDDSTEEKCKSLINMPVVAKYKKINGKDDLGGHEVSIINGKVQFGTATIGVVTNVEIVVEEVETTSGIVRKLPVLYADERIWTRNTNCTNAIRRLYSESNLHSSWELKTSEYEYKDNVKYIKDYAFLSNCLLGTMSYPAYGKKAAVVTEVSETSDEYEYLAAETLLEEALALDIESASASNINLNQLDDTNRKEDLSMDVNENVVVETSEEEVKEETAEVVNAEEAVEATTEEVENNETAEVSDNDPAEESSTVGSEADVESETNDVINTTDSSAMKTYDDIRKLLEEAVAKETLEDDGWYGVSMIFPEDHIVLCHSWHLPSLNFLKFDYEINDDVATLTNRENIELVVSPLQINSEIENKNNAIAEANNRIVELENQNAELAKAKEELDKIKEAQASAERSEKVNKLREYVIKSGRFSEEELSSEKIQDAINNLNEAWIKAEIADRLVASLTEVKDQKVETSEKKDTKNTVSIMLSEDEKVTSEDVMREFFKN